MSHNTRAAFSRTATRRAAHLAIALLGLWGKQRLDLLLPCEWWRWRWHGHVPVSYTHLTLPTILLV
eukprot:5617227-Pleurochrysis_carterae.AAC.2